MTNQPASTQLTVRDYMHKDEVIKSFVDVVGNERQANAYITSVLLAVANSPKLQECTPTSIMTSAMRAATLRLSCDPGLGHAWLVPYKGKATLQLGYKGLYQMAIRTNKYRYLNVSKVYEGEELIEDRLTGMVTLGGSRKSNVVIGYFLYFELVSGFRKVFSMTVEELMAHGERYSPSFGYDNSLWKTHPQEMMKKTVLRLGLSKWGYFDPQDKLIIDQVDDSEVVDTTAEPVDDEQEIAAPEPEPRRSEAELLAELGY